MQLALPGPETGEDCLAYLCAQGRKVGLILLCPVVRPWRAQDAQNQVENGRINLTDEAVGSQPS